MGTGVLIAGSAGEARNALAYLSEHEIGSGPVLVEEYVPGTEISVSVLAGAAGEMVVWPAAREFNRLGGDRTAITHGMGALAPVPVDAAVLDTVVDWLGRLVDALGRQGRVFRGWLTTNVILGPRGPELLEFNCHAGDPETQTVLPVIQAPLTGLLTAAAPAASAAASTCTGPRRGPQQRSTSSAAAIRACRQDRSGSPVPWRGAKESRCTRPPLTARTWCPEAAG